MKDRIRAGAAVDPVTGCWNWKKCVQGNGYGRIRTGARTLYVHRASYQAFHGPIPEGMDVCHKCDNRRCCNPEHLFAGTRLDNMRDALEKGRVSHGERHSIAVPKGEANSKAKLSANEVVVIRSLVASGQCRKEVAGRFGVSYDNINRIVNRNTWRHV